MNNNYLVYKHISPSNKAYIGITNNYSKRSRQHQQLAAKGEGFAFHAAIRKYGWDKFKHEIIVENISKEEARLIEVLMIKELNTYAPNGYNLTIGGEGVDGESSRKGKIANRKDSVRGYNWNEKAQSYQVQLSYRGKVLNFGLFKDESDAKDRADYLMSLSDEELVKAHEEYKAGFSTRSKGYTFNKASSKFRVQLTVDGKQKFFGLYLTEQEAINRVVQLRSEF
jgi:group I intron endonuclease